MKVNELSSGIKSVADIIKKGENFELYAMLLDLYEKALELQDENKQLKEKLVDRQSVEVIRTRVIRHSQPVITLKDDENQIYYCAHCWDSKDKMIQVNTEPKQGTFTCPSCNNSGVYNYDAHERYEEELRRARRPRVTII